MTLAALVLAAAVANPAQATADACVMVAAIAKSDGQHADPVVGGVTPEKAFKVALSGNTWLPDDVKALLSTAVAGTAEAEADCMEVFRAAGVKLLPKDFAGPGFGASFARPVFSADGRLAAVYRWAFWPKRAVRVDVVVGRKIGEIWTVSHRLQLFMAE